MSHPTLAVAGGPGIGAALDASSHPLVGTDESRLIERAVRGDRIAARTIYNAHVDAIYRLSFRIAGPDLAEECTQDAFVRAFQRLSFFRRESALRTWLHSITVSVALNLKRREKRRTSSWVPLEAAPDLEARSTDTDPLLTSRIHAAIGSLPDELRAVVVLNLMEGHTHPEIASILDIPEGTSKARLSRARARLREALADLDPAISPGF
jgi:RNA polymerase sigma factor (sigma-70 family)